MLVLVLGLGLGIWLVLGSVLGLGLMLGLWLGLMLGLGLELGLRESNGMPIAPVHVVPELKVVVRAGRKVHWTGGGQHHPARSEVPVSRKKNLPIARCGTGRGVVWCGALWCGVA